MRIVSIISIALMICAVTAFSQPLEEESIYRPTVAFMPFSDLNPVDSDIPVPPGGMPPPPGGTPPPPGGGKTFDINGAMPYLSNGIPEMMYFMLQKTGTINVYNITSLRIALSRNNVELDSDTPIDNVISTARVRGAEYIIGGSFDKNEADISITVDIYNLDGSKIGSNTVSGKIEDFFKLEQEAAETVLAELGIDYQYAPMGITPTSSMEAFKYFSIGAAKTYTGERLAQFNMGLGIDANFAELHIKIAEADRQEGSFDPAKTAYEKARAINDVYPEVPTNLAVIARKNKLDSATIRALADEALMMDANYPKALEVLQQTYYSDEDYVKAAEICDKYIEVQPGNKMAYYYRGNAGWRMGLTSPKWEKILRQAITFYDKSIEIDPTFGQAYYARGSLYSIFKDAPMMIESFKQTLRYNKKAKNRVDIIKTIYANGGECSDLILESAITQEELDAALAVEETNGE